MIPIIDRKNLIFIIALFFEVLAMMISITTIPYMVDNYTCNLLLKMLRYLGYAIILFKILNDDFTVIEITAILAVTVVLMLNSVTVGGNTLLCLFLFVIGMRNVDFKLVCKISLLWYLLGIAITILGSQCGLIENWDYTSGARVRHALGYFYPSHATSVMLYTMCLFCYVLGNKLTFWQVILLEVLNILQYKETNARAGTLLMVIMPILFWTIKIDKKKISERLYGTILTLAFPVCAMLSILISLIYSGNGILLKINNMLSNRFSLAHEALKEYGVSAFGEEIKWIGNGGYGYVFTHFDESYNYVDCSYVRILLDYGVIFFVIVIIGFSLAARKAKQENDKYLLLSLAFVAMYSIIEPRLLEIGFNNFVLVLVSLIPQKENTKMGFASGGVLHAGNNT